MSSVLQGFWHSLVQLYNGFHAYVFGDNTLRVNYIPTDDISLENNSNIDDDEQLPHMAEQEVINNDDPPPHPPRLRRSFSGYITNIPEEIYMVNNNRGTRVILNVRTNAYTTWYYYHDDYGKFFFVISINLGNGPTEEFQELDGPIDPDLLSTTFY